LAAAAVASVFNWVLSAVAYISGVAAYIFDCGLPLGM
jgi:hypothetical protein